jgi:hypothetical protein
MKAEPPWQLMWTVPEVYRNMRRLLLEYGPRDGRMKIPKRYTGYSPRRYSFLCIM